MRIVSEWARNLAPGLLVMTLILVAQTTGVRKFHAQDAVLLPMLPPLLSTLSTDTNIPASDVAQVDTFVTEQMDRHDLPGLALALVDGDQVTFMKGYGAADQTGRPITAQTPFILASVSKPLTAAAGTFIHTWVFNNTRGSVWIAMVLHASSNAASNLVTQLLPSDVELTGWQQVLNSGWLNVIVFSLIALLLVIFTRGALGYRSERADY